MINADYISGIMLSAVVATDRSMFSNFGLRKKLLCNVQIPYTFFVCIFGLSVLFIATLKTKSTKTPQTIALVVKTLVGCYCVSDDILIRMS